MRIDVRDRVSFVLASTVTQEYLLGENRLISHRSLLDDGFPLPWGRSDLDFVLLAGSTSRSYDPSSVKDSKTLLLCSSFCILQRRELIRLTRPFIFYCILLLVAVSRLNSPRVSPLSLSTRSRRNI
jgi:hypothetical protein